MSDAGEAADNAEADNEMEVSPVRRDIFTGIITKKLREREKKNEVGLEHKEQLPEERRSGKGNENSDE